MLCVSCESNGVVRASLYFIDQVAEFGYCFLRVVDCFGQIEALCYVDEGLFRPVRVHEDLPQLVRRWLFDEDDSWLQVTSWDAPGKVELVLYLEWLMV